MRPLSRIISAFSVFLFLVTCSMNALAQQDNQDTALNPVRLSYINGKVSFWRYGAEDWTEARINIPLAGGDALYVGKDAELELQVGGRAFIRADDDTQITIVNQAADFLQLKVTSGRVSLDLRTLPASGYTVELDTPNAVFTIDHTGYYRVDVDTDVHFITRRGGQAAMTLAGGEAMRVFPSEEIVVQGTDVAQAETYVAPELDQWDRWNYDRTNNLIDAVSERYLPAGIAGARDLDYYGSWRVVPDYGTVWVPEAVPSGWVPFSTGRWIWDPYYQWTWVDDMPWGWAPCHYGRWVHIGGYWAWAPGPVVARRPVYAPALVAFFGLGSHTSIGISIGSGVGWVALSWGEPLVPWWGRPGFVGRPWWGGWHGPHVVNRAVVRPTTVINITNITYANTHIANAVVATTPDHFGRGHVREMPLHFQGRESELVHAQGALPIKPKPESLVAGAPTSMRPPEQVTSRPVIATRRPQESSLPWHSGPSLPKAVEQRYVPAPKPTTELRRPAFGAQTGPERARPPLPPRYEEWKRQAAPAAPSAIIPGAGEVDRPVPQVSRTAPPEMPARVSPERRQQVAPAGKMPPLETRPEIRPVIPQQIRPEVRQEVRPGVRQEMRPETRQGSAESARAGLPGNPANRTYRGRGQFQSEQRRSQH